MKSKPQAPKPKPRTQQPQPNPAPAPSLEEKLATAKAEQDKWTWIAAHPSLSPAAAAWARDAARSAGAAAALYQKALIHQEPESDQGPPPPKSKQPAPQQPVLSPQQKLERAQADHRKWSAIAADPKLSPKAAAWAKDVARMAAAEVTLRQKALTYKEPETDLELEKLFGITRSPQGRLSFSNPGNRPSSTAPKTSA